MDYSKFNNIKLCDIIITYRYLGLMKDESISAMEELAKRRASGDVFEFEKYIEEKMKELPDFKKELNLLDYFNLKK